MSKKQKKVWGNRNVMPIAILVVGAMALLGLLGKAVFDASKADKQRAAAEEMLKPNEFGCTSSPVKSAPAGVERVACKSANHVATGTKVAYESDPPLSGEHYSTWVNPGFYSEAKQKELLVHSLEHGYVVIYYNQQKLSAEQLKAVRTVAEKYKGNWDGVVAIPRDDAQYALILTAWEHALRLPEFDQARLDSFVDAFRGRGPENPVRL